jgi:hypothetical protein
MLQSITSYTAAVQTRPAGRGVSHDFVIVIKFGAGSDARMDTTDAATFAAWMALLSTGKATYDPEASQLIVSG